MRPLPLSPEPLVSTTRLVLCALEPALASAWEEACGGLDFVTVHRGSILEVSADALVSPANSFGFMAGGIDAAYVRHFGPELQARVQRMILEEHHGELLVGAAGLVETGNERTPWLIAAPTMRVPAPLPADSVNAYLAARAVFLLLEHGRMRSGLTRGPLVSERIRTVAMPGLGTGVGGMPARVCARQVRAAIDDVLLGGLKLPASGAEAAERHRVLAR
ncbi:Appr-1-p processing protein [Aggregicoccus sp. 17bor-14]|nr:MULTISPECIES: macro domain-containing protein [Myxococcaceae]MBF5043299.1 macro domain-containing protein [Simulacricoccus sp. 17bor-14]MRI89057.1 Appr-1-p processing protein [Aggregicoccus sp. 17bor-14]